MKDICAAIMERRPVSLWYDGGARVVEMWAHGSHRKTGHEVVRVYQLSGYSSSGRAEGWRLFLVSGIADFAGLQETFSTDRALYNPADRDMNPIHCHI